MRTGDAGSRVAVCTLSSVRLLERLSASGALRRVAAAGRLMSENRGIDELVRFVAARPRVTELVLCGRDARGHLPGASLLALHRNGTDAAGRILSSPSPDPVLRAGAADVRAFRSRVRVADMVGEEDPARVAAAVARLL